MEVKRRKWLGIALGAIGTLLLIAYIAIQVSQGPAYQGRTMRWWFESTVHHSNVTTYFRLQTSSRFNPRRPMIEPKQFVTPSVEAFRQLQSEGSVGFLTNQLLRSANWFERNDAKLRKYLPGFTHRFLPQALPQTDRQIAALFLLRHLCANDSAHSAIMNAVRARPRDADLRRRFNFQDIRLDVLLETGGHTPRSVESLLAYAQLTSDWHRINQLLADPKLQPTLNAMLPRLLTLSKAAPANELHYFSDLFRRTNPSAPETLAFHEHAVRKHRNSRSIGPLLEHMPDAPWLIAELVELIRHPISTVMASGPAANPYELNHHVHACAFALAHLAPAREEEVRQAIDQLTSSTLPLARAAGARLWQLSLNHPDWQQHRDAATEQVRKLAADKEPMVRYHAGEFLWIHHQEPDLKIAFILEDLLANPQHSRASIRNFEFLGLHGRGHPQALETLVDLARNSDSNGIRASATKALANLGPEALGPLKELAQDTNPNVSETAREAVQKMNQKRNKPAAAKTPNRP